MSLFWVIIIAILGAIQACGMLWAYGQTSMLMGAQRAMFVVLWPVLLIPFNIQ